MKKRASAAIVALLCSLPLGGAPLHAQTYPGPGRNALFGSLTLFVDNVSGNDANNGLTSGTAFATVAKAFSVLQNNYDTKGNTVTIQAAASQTWTNLSFQGSVTGGGLVTFDAGGGTVNGTSGAALLVELTSAGSLGNTFFNFQNGTITCSGGAAGIEIGGGLVTTNTNVTFGSCTGGPQVFADSNAARWLPLANYTISGGGTYHNFALGGGLIDVNNAGLTVTVSGTPAFSTCFMGASKGGLALGYATYSGAATGTRYCATQGGFIDSNGGGANKFPGNAAGFVNVGGKYDSPGTPAASACGTSPNPVISGTDQSFTVQEGGAGTQGTCTLTFTTANTPKACNFASSNSTAFGTLAVTVLNATTLTFTHTAVNNALFYVNCPAP